MEKAKQSPIDYDVIEWLLQEINELKEQVEDLKRKQVPSIYDDLVRFWDNEYDEQWNNY